MFATVASCSLLLPLLKMRKQKRRRCRIDVGGRRMHGNIKDGQADGMATRPHIWSPYVNNATVRHVPCWPLWLPPPSPDTRCTLPKIHTLHHPQAHAMSPGLLLIHMTYLHRQNDLVWVVHHRHRALVHYPRRLRGIGATSTSFKHALRAQCA